MKSCLLSKHLPWVSALGARSPGLLALWEQFLAERGKQEAWSLTFQVLHSFIALKTVIFNTFKQFYFLLYETSDVYSKAKLFFLSTSEHVAEQNYQLSNTINAKQQSEKLTHAFQPLRNHMKWDIFLAHCQVCAFWGKFQ